MAVCRGISPSVDCVMLILVIGTIEGRESEGSSTAAYHGGLTPHLTSLSDGSRIIV